VTERDQDAAVAALVQLFTSLYPDLDPAEARARIGAAMSGEIDPAWRRIVEEVANDPAMLDDLARRLSEVSEARRRQLDELARRLPNDRESRGRP
jgi:glutathione S-transferase